MTATSAPAPVPTPAPAPPAPAAASSAPAPAPAAGPAPAAPALFTAAPAPAPSPAAGTAAAPETAWLPEKYRVNGADGALDLAASAKKLAEGYAAAEKRIGTGDLPPQDPSKYAFTIPESLKGVEMDQALVDGFRSEAHKAGLTQKQYEFVMGKYFELVPGLLGGAAKHTAEQARAELQQTWKGADFEANMASAQRAIHGMPADLQTAAIERFGTDPVFARVMAHYGAAMREDKGMPAAASSAGAQTAQALMASEAYRNPKHPDHQRVSEQVSDHFKRLHGAAAAT